MCSALRGAAVPSERTDSGKDPVTARDDLTTTTAEAPPDAVSDPASDASVPDAGAPDASAPEVAPRRRPSCPVASPRQELAAKLLITVYLLATVTSVWVWGISRDDLGHFTSFFFTLLNIPLTLSLVSVVLIVTITGALVRRKRVALIAVGVLQALGLLWSVLALVRATTHASVPVINADASSLGSEGLVRVIAESTGLVVAVLLLALVWWIRPAFPARVSRGSWWQSVLAIAVGYALTVVVTRLIIGDRTIDTDGAHPFNSVMGAVMRQALGVARRRDGAILDQMGWLPAVPEVMLAATIGLAVWLFLRSARPTGAWEGDTEVRVRALLAEYGADDSLGYFATRRDKSFLFSPDGRAVVSFRVVGAVCLMSGDPIGARDSWPAAIAEWRRVCREFGWLPAATSCSERGARELKRSCGLGVMVLGDEAVLEPERYTLEDTSMTSVRHAVARARRAGLELRIRYHDELSAGEMSEVVRLADEWRIGGAERGFSMALERLGDPADGRCVLVTAHDADGKPVGMLSFVPWGRTGLSLDLMRRSPDAPHGVTEFMVSGLMAAGDEQGIARVSLNFAVMRSTFAAADELGAGALTRAGSSVLRFFDRFTQIESLYRNNDKYQPAWIPRYACIEAPFDLPRVLIAIGKAEGFLPTLTTEHTGGKKLDGPQLARVREIQTWTPDPSAGGPHRADQTRHRLRHLEELRAAGHDPFAVGREGGRRLATWRRGDATPPIRLLARVRRIRRHGGVVFCDLVDGDAHAQAVVERGVIGDEELRVFGRCVDTGDLLAVDVAPGASRNGTPSLLVRSWDVMAKALHPIPFTSPGRADAFPDVGQRLKRRSTDLLVHPRARELLEVRTTAVAAVRAALVADGYREVETPMLGAVHGGATARPFRTRSNAYRSDLVLRIAPELQLKRLLVGGMGPVFEMGRNFRNEGADATHNPEFTSLEVYRPFGDYTTMRRLTEALIKATAVAVHGREALPLVMKKDLLRRAGDPGAPAPELVDVSGEWPVVTVCEAVSRAVGRPMDQHTDLETLLALAQQHGVAVADHMGPGAVLEELYGELVEPATFRPTFYVDFPAETSPLTAPHRNEEGLVERWDLVAGGMELGTAYSELTDPIEQRRRLTEQSFKAAAGDVEAMEIDEDFLYALETGMPPTGGLGIGVDRLVMALTGTSIRDVLTFPFVRPDRTA